MLMCSLLIYLYQPTYTCPHVGKTKTTPQIRAPVLAPAPRPPHALFPRSCTTHAHALRSYTLLSYVPHAHTLGTLILRSHTHYFSCVLLTLFLEAPSEAVKEQITRVLLERLIVNRPHPWVRAYIMSLYVIANSPWARESVCVCVCHVGEKV